MVGDMEDYFKDIVVVSLRIEEPCQHIVFKSCHPTAPYIETKQIHHF